MSAYQEVSFSGNSNPIENADPAHVEEQNQQRIAASAESFEEQPEYIPRSNVSFLTILSPTLNVYSGIALARILYYITLITSTISILVMTFFEIVNTFYRFGGQWGWGFVGIIFLVPISVLSLLISYFGLKLFYELVISILVIRQHVTKMTKV